MKLNIRKRVLLALQWLRPYGLRWLYFALLRKPRPRYLSDCWAYPCHKFSQLPEALARLPESPTEPDLLFFPMTDWHARTQRSQHLAMAFASAGHRCFYVNPHLGFQFRSVYLRDREPRLSRLAPRILELHLRVPREPVIHFALPTQRECRTLQNALEQLIRHSEGRRFVQVVSLPFWLDVALGLKRVFGFPIVYDCHDLLSGFLDMGRELVDREPDLFRSCDLAVFSSQPLMDTKIADFPWLAGKSLLVRNAAAAAGASSIESSEPSRPAKVIGYIGSLDHWFDVAALRSAATRRTDWEFVLIGRIESDSLLPLQGLGNVRFLGEVPYSQVGQHLAGFDVAIIPFLRTELTVAANPIKLYEYFGYGLPVVSTRLPEVEMFGDLVYLADGPEDFADKLEMAVAEHDPALRLRRVAIAKNETWAARVALLQSAFERIPDLNVASAPLSE